MTDKKIRAYYKPTEDFMLDYVDLAEKSVIVKALTTEAPIKPVDGVMMPTLEKMLVDINADPDFYYLQGNETFNIMQNARSLYSIIVGQIVKHCLRSVFRHLDI